MAASKNIKSTRTKSQASRKKVANRKKATWPPKKKDRRNLIIVVLVFALIGAYFLIHSFAASTAVSSLCGSKQCFTSSGYVLDQNNQPVAGVTIVDCQKQTVQTDANGYYAFSLPKWWGYCTRVSALPAGVTTPVIAYNARPEAGAHPSSYEWQVIGAQCYHNTTYCGYNKVGGNDAVTLYDMSPENALNFHVTRNSTPPPPPTADPVITAAGDISCDPADPNYNNLNGTPTACQMKATSNLILNINPTAVLPLGDIQYESDVYTKYMTSYDVTWGRFKNITHPVIGNHEGGEGQTHSNKAYFDYFNGTNVQTGLAGDRSKGYYSYNLGAWHLIALNSNCGTYWFGGVQTGCQAGSPQETWLRQDLAANQAKCTLAYWHVPRFSSGSSHHNDASTDTVYTTLWNDLYNAHAELVLNGHDHDYERFAPQRPDGTADAANGIREFVVGTGGENHYSFTTIVKNSEVRNKTDFGVLKLTLHPTSYDWQFVNTAGSVLDSGTNACH